MIFIISESLAKDGIVDVLDWISRDSETRSEAYILISREASARDILLKSKQSNKPISYNIYRTLHAQKDLSKAPKVEIYKFINMLSSEGVSSILPSISNSTYESEAFYEVAGTALFKKDKLVGFIDGDETKYLLFVKDEVKGGLLIEETNISEKHHSLVLEIKKSNTKLKPDISSGELKMKMDINIQATLAEIATPQFNIDETTIKKLEKSSEETLEDNIRVLIKKIQNGYNVDVFGFGRTVKENMPKLWKSQASNWDELFKDLKVDVNAKIQIKNTAFTSEPIKLGD